jgi:CRP/FNR family transcriptional regulator, cyclic AMP receptor protein
VNDFFLISFKYYEVIMLNILENSMQEDTMWGNIFRKQAIGKPGILTVLSSIPMFNDLSKKELKAIERILHKRTYKKDEVLFNEGDPGVGMYIIEQGRINISIGSENKMVASLSNGEFFGEMALLSEIPRTATALAAVPTNILGFFQSDLFGLTETNPKMGNKILFKIAQMIADRLRFSNIENQQLREKINELENKSKTKKSD